MCRSKRVAKGALSRALVDVCVDLANEDLGAIEGQEVELVAKALVVAVRPKRTDRSPDFLVAVLVTA
jgi:hypothetical protein